jgi:hypothetical protein
MVSDGKGGKIKVKKPKAGKKGKDGKEKKWYDDVAEFSDATTDSDAVDLDAMTPEEREKYLKEREKRRAAREQKRREKYGDKYDEMFAAKEACVESTTLHLFCVFALASLSLGDGSSHLTSNNRIIATILDDDVINPVLLPLFLLHV